jgi:hypothetical protein
MRHMGYLCSSLVISRKSAFYGNTRNATKRTAVLALFNLATSLETFVFSGASFKGLVFVHSDKYLFFVFSCLLWSLFTTHGEFPMFCAMTFLSFFFSSLICSAGTIVYFANLFVFELRGNASALFLIFSDYFSSVNNFFGFKYNFNLIVSNPFVDIDLTANTDCEDMLVFFGDILEFVEQDKAFLADAVLDSWFLLNWNSALFALEAVFLVKMRKQVLSVVLAKFFNA